MFSVQITCNFSASSEEETDLSSCDLNGSSLDGDGSFTFRDVEMLILTAFMLKPFYLNSDFTHHSEQLFSRVCKAMAHYHAPVGMNSIIYIDCQTSLRTSLLFSPPSSSQNNGFHTSERLLYSLLGPTPCVRHGDDEPVSFSGSSGLYFDHPK